MNGKLSSRLTFANVTSCVALFVALGGTGYAAITVTGANVRNASLTGADVRNESLTGADTKDGSLAARDFAAGQLPAGPGGQPGRAGAPGAAGQQGAKGEPGPAGAKGEPGAAGAAGTNGTNGSNGSPDTAQQVLDKLKTVDGPSSLLDADLLDGATRAALAVKSRSATVLDAPDPGTNPTPIITVSPGIEVATSSRLLANATVQLSAPANGATRTSCHLRYAPTEGDLLLASGGTSTQTLPAAPSGSAGALHVQYALASVAPGAYFVSLSCLNSGAANATALDANISVIAVPD